MNKFYGILLCTISLAACGKNDIMATSSDLEAHLENPLYAERYFDSLVDTMVDLVIQNDPILEKEGMGTLIEETRKASLEKAQDATAMQREGYQGVLVSDYEYSVGEVLILNNMLYTGPDFETAPGPDLRMYLSTLVDPRVDGQFPDERSIDLGNIQNSFGDQAFTIPSMPESGTGSMKDYPSVVLYDTKIERIYGFAQLRKSK